MHHETNNQPFLLGRKDQPALETRTVRTVTGHHAGSKAITHVTSTLHPPRLADNAAAVVVTCVREK